MQWNRALCGLWLACSACGAGLAGELASPVDGGSASSLDAGPAQDAGSVDAGNVSDAGFELDAGTDAGLDAGFDAGVDAGDPPGTFAAFGGQVRHLRSLDDGASWVDDATMFDAGQTGDLYAVRSACFGNGLFVAFAAKVFTSPDAKTWTEVPKAEGQWVGSMLYAQGQWVSAGGYGWLATTVTDLGTWTQHPPAANYTTAHHAKQGLSHGLVSGADAYVVVDDAGALFHSTDGKTWHAATGAPAVTGGASTLAFGNGAFVGLLGTGTATVRSTDSGATWTVNSALSSSVQGLVFGHGHFTALGTGHVFTSDDGQTWVDHASSTAKAGDLTYGHGTWLSLNNGVISRSVDEVTWTKILDTHTDTNPVEVLLFGAK